MFRRRDQSHMPFGKGVFLDLRDGSNHRHTTIGFNRLPNHGLVSRTRQTIEDHTGDI